MIKFNLSVNGEERTFGFDAMRGRSGMEFLQVAERAGDIRPALPAVHGHLLEGERDVFESEGANLGQRWVPYNHAERFYKKMKSAVLGTDEERLMRWSNGHERLFPSLTESHDQNHIWRESAHGFVFGTALPYAKGHQTGTGMGWVPKRAKNKAKYFYIVPKRVILGVTSANFGEIIRTLQGYIFGTAGGRRTRGGIFG
jgi:phage gpG-like protein